MTLMQHLIELRHRIIVCCITVGVAAVAGWFLYPPISHVLVHPYNEIAASSIAGGNLIATSPVEGFAVRIKITAYVAIALAMPVILWQIWRFVSPGLYKHEKRYALPFILSAIRMLEAGVATAWRPWCACRSRSWWPCTARSPARASVSRCPGTCALPVRRPGSARLTWRSDGHPTRGSLHCGPGLSARAMELAQQLARLPGQAVAGCPTGVRLVARASVGAA